VPLVIAGLLLCSAPAHAGAGDDAFYVRGDADCSLNRSVGDLLATIADLGATDRCGNGDCDRDGDRDGADVDCVLGCLFGACPIPPGAPVIESVEPDTADAVVPFSTIRLFGSGFGDEESIKSVTIGGIPAEVVEYLPPDEISVVVPDIAAGATEVTVADGEIEGAPFPLTVVEAQLTGDPFLFLSLLDGLNNLAVEIEARGVEGLSEGDDAIVAAELALFRTALFDAYGDALAAADSPAELQARLALAAESSGLIDRLSELLDEVRASESVATVNGPVVAAVPRETIKAVARGVTSGARTVIAAAPAAGARAATVTLGSVVSGLATLLGAAVAAQAGIDALADTPLISEVSFGGEVVPGELFTVYGGGFGSVPPLPVLRVTMPNGLSVRLVAESSGETADRQLLRFRLPVTPGVCGKGGRMRLVRELFDKSSGDHPLLVKPRIVEVNPDIVELRENFTLNTRGVVGCTDTTRIWIDREPPGSDVQGRWPVGSVKNETEIVTRISSGIVPDLYEIYVRVGIFRSRDDKRIRLLTDLDGLFIVCQTPSGNNRLNVGQTTRCTANPLGGMLPRPSTVVVSWTLEGATEAVEIVSTDGAEATLRGERGGVVTVKATLRSDTGQLIAETEQASVLTVVDAAPEIEIRSPNRQAPQTVPPGTVLQIIATAEDDSALERLVLDASGDAVVAADRMQQFACINVVDECQTTFAVALREEGFASDEVSVTVTAVDSGGNETASNQLVFKVAAGEIAGRVVDAADG